MSLQNLRKWLIFFAMVGYSAGYANVYVFHILLSLWIALSIGKKSIEHQGIHLKRYHLFAFLFLFFCLLTFFWSSEKSFWARYLFYYFCGVMLLVAVVDSCRNQKQFMSVFKVCAIVAVFNLILGLLESSGIFRLPTSPYSQYVSLFGRTPSDLSSFSDFAVSIVDRKPTGLNWNPNNFGFFVVLCYPFFLFKSRAYAMLSTAAFIWLAFAVASKGMFVSGLTALALVSFYQNRGAVTAMSTWFSILGLAGLFFVFANDLQEIYGANRVLSSFSEISRGLDFIAAGGTSEAGSTAVRANIYYSVWQAFVSTFGLGLGIGGSEAYLIQFGHKINSLHFFVLQLLYEFGFVIFTIIMAAYFRLAYVVYDSSKLAASYQQKYIAKSISLSLICAVPASISPSGVHYILPFYILIGLAIGVVRVIRDSQKGMEG